MVSAHNHSKVRGDHLLSPSAGWARFEKALMGCCLFFFSNETFHNAAHLFQCHPFTSPLPNRTGTVNRNDPINPFEQTVTVSNHSADVPEAGNMLAMIHAPCLSDQITKGFVRLMMLLATPCLSFLWIEIFVVDTKQKRSLGCHGKPRVYGFDGLVPSIRRNNQQEWEKFFLPPYG